MLHCCRNLLTNCGVPHHLQVVLCVTGARSSCAMLFQECKKKIKHRLEKGGKLLMAPARLVGNCFYPR